jgi:TonB family protein
MPNRYDPPEKAKVAPSPASDVWSLGMTLAESLTQRIPAWTEKEAGGPMIPESMPAPFLDIVRGCLRRNPQLRLTIAEIASALHPTPHPAREVIPSKALSSPPLPQRPLALTTSQFLSRVYLEHRSWINPAIIAALTVTVLFGGFGLLRRQPDGRSSPSPAIPEATPQVKAAGHSATSDSPLSRDVADTSRSKPSPVASRQEETSPAAVDRPDESLTTATDGSGQDADVVREVLPTVPQKALKTIQGTVRVGITVQVDPSGAVVGTDLSSPGPSRYFARLAAEAAQRWRFSPSSENAGREYIVRFDFTSAETKATATRAP